MFSGRSAACRRPFLPSGQIRSSRPQALARDPSPRLGFRRAPLPLPPVSPVSLLPNPRSPPCPFSTPLADEEELALGEDGGGCLWGGATEGGGEREEADARAQTRRATGASRASRGAGGAGGRGSPGSRRRSSYFSRRAARPLVPVPLQRPSSLPPLPSPASSPLAIAGRQPRCSGSRAASAAGRREPACRIPAIHHRQEGDGLPESRRPLPRRRRHPRVHTTGATRETWSMCRSVSPAGLM